jgi:glutathione synthase/RimK-type ligase-like ATP-grasp enzyme
MTGPGLPGAALPFAPLIGVAPLMRMAFRGADLGPIGAALLARAQANEQDANALLDCSTVLQLNGQRALALAMQAQAIQMQNYYTLPARGTGTAIRLLAIMGPGDLMANTPIEFLLEDSDVTLQLLYLTLEQDWPAPELLADHDVVLVAMAESASNQPLLARLAGYIADWPRPVLNHPRQIAGLSRDGVSSTLAHIDGIDMPATVVLDRKSVEQLGECADLLSGVLPDASFPLIVRPLGSHAGQDLQKIADAAALAGYLERIDARHFYLSRFVDYRSPDGRFRKYRIALIDGHPFICHFAISDHWMIHYLNAGMDADPAKRAEEAHEMASFDQGFARRHQDALRTISERIGLPYLGIDCAENLAGELLVFEVDNAMVVHAMDDPALYPYKQPAMRKVFKAFRALLESRCGPAPRTVLPGPGSGT